MALKWQENALKRLIISEFDEKHDQLYEYDENTRILVWMIDVLRDEIVFFIISCVRAYLLMRHDFLKKMIYDREK